MSLRKAVLFMALMSGACSEPSAAGDTVSVLPYVETLRPVIACIEDRVARSDALEVWQGGAPQGPAQSQETMQACTQGIRLTTQEPADLSDANVYRMQVFTMALMGFGDHRDHLTVKDFDEALEIARCVENEATSDDDFFSRDPGKSRAVELQALRTCAPQIVAYATNPESSSARPRSDLLVVPMAVSNLNYIRAKRGLLAASGSR